MCFAASTDMQPATFGAVTAGILLGVTLTILGTILVQRRRCSRHDVDNDVANQRKNSTLNIIEETYSTIKDQDLDPPQYEKCRSINDLNNHKQEHVYVQVIN